MKGKFKHQESRGLPGGPNEVFEYITGVFSTDGYKRDSPDVNNPFNIIKGNQDGTSITMQDVDFPVMGTDNLGNQQAMIPGNDYQFPGDQVFEIPMAQTGGGKIGKRGFLYTNNDIISGGGTLNFPTGTRINASAVVPKGFNPTFKGSGSFGINQQLGNFNIGNRLDVPVRNDDETGERLPYTLKNTLSAEWKKALGNFNLKAGIVAPLIKNSAGSLELNPEVKTSVVYNIPPNKKKFKGELLADGGFIPKAQTGKQTPKRKSSRELQKERWAEDLAADTKRVLGNVPVSESTNVIPYKAPVKEERLFNTEDLIFDTMTEDSQQNKHDEAIDWVKKWSDSEMYKKMLTESANSLSEADRIKSGRIENLEDMGEVDIHQHQDRAGVNASSSSKSGKITMYPSGFTSPDTFVHEGSHSQDRPRDGQGRLIPQSDLDLIKKHSPKKGASGKDLYDKLSPNKEAVHWDFQSDNTQKKYNKKAGKVDYISNPTETRARLNAIRYMSEEKGIYEPMNEPINKEQFQKLLDTELRESGKGPLYDLKQIYTEDQIFEMLNTISSTEGNEPLNQQMAKYGGSTTVSDTDADTYKAYFNEEDKSKKAKKIYDKLNRVYYAEAKTKKMSPPNYILTYIITP